MEGVLIVIFIYETCILHESSTVEPHESTRLLSQIASAGEIHDLRRVCNGFSTPSNERNLLKNSNWKMISVLGRQIFRGVLVSFKEGIQGELLLDVLGFPWGIFRCCFVMKGCVGWSKPWKEAESSLPSINFQVILLMEEIRHHLRCIKPCKKRDKLPTSTG